MGEHKINGGLGFQDLESFNKALIAKQLWRVLTQPHSLVATILREKYYKSEGFMTVKAKGTKSLLWTSLWAARQLIEGGSRWRIRNGETIKI